VLGWPGRWPSCRGSLLARGVAQAYTTLIRAVPDLVLMLLVFYGGQMAVNSLGERWAGATSTSTPSWPAS
jgi:arginine/ornithine transport system permease protein